VRQLDRALVLFVVFPIPIVRNQAEDIWRDLIDGSEGVFHGPNEAEKLEYIVSKSVDLL
jgi:hypothetical protein